MRLPTSTSRLPRPRGAHLVGSVPLASAEDVFRTAGETLGGHLRRIPDGETGPRSTFFAFQAGVLDAHPAFERVDGEAQRRLPLPQFALAPGVDPDSVAFDGLGYATAARDSFATFTALKREGIVPEDVRFLVTMPTPRNVVQGLIDTPARETVEPIYERAMLGEIARILDAVPHDELAFQVDAVFEVGVWNGTFPFEGGRSAALERLLVLARAVPEDVELGFHLCYGDYGHKHFAQPEDTAVLVELAQAILGTLERPVNWIHMPVPRDRSDETYFAPLAGLELPAATELYLGLVHHTDGVSGTQARIAAAQRVRDDFGVATECGFGRRPVEQVGELLRIHAQLADPVR